jgi:peptidoglycan/LPS O-acetylase OafA/YrhL
VLYYHHAVSFSVSPLCHFYTLSSLVFFYLVLSCTALSCLMSARDCIRTIIIFLLSSHSEYFFFFFFFFFFFRAAIAICSILLPILCYFRTPSSLRSHHSSSSSSFSSFSCPSSSSPSRPYTDYLPLYSLLSVTSKGVAFYHVILMSYSMPVMVRTVHRHCYCTYSLVLIFCSDPLPRSLCPSTSPSIPRPLPQSLCPSTSPSIPLSLDLSLNPSVPRTLPQ